MVPGVFSFLKLLLSCDLYARGAYQTRSERATGPDDRSRNESLPLLALSIYANNDKADITAADTKEMKAEVQDFIKNLTGEKQ
jgi:hypothetical protein